MSFAAFILKLEADAKGVEKGVNTAVNHFKRLGATVKGIEQRQEAQRKMETKLATERLKPEERLNQLLRTREQIANRLARVEDPRTKNLYLQKQLEVEKNIAAARTAAARAPWIAAGRFAGGLLVGGGAVGAMANFSATAANELTDAQLTSGLSLQALQKLRAGADATGTSFPGLTRAAGNVRVAQSGALNGNAKMLKAFSQAGLSESDLRSMTPEEIFFKLAQGGANLGNVSALQKIFGEGSDEVIKAFGNGLGRAAERLERFGLLMDDSMIEALSGFKSDLQFARSALKQVAQWAAGGLTSGFLRLGLRAKSVGALFAGGGLDAAGELQARADLIGDSDYAESLARTKDLQQRLELAIERRDGEESDRQAAAEEEAKRYFRAYQARQERQRTSRFGTLGSGNHIDTDELAKIGLFRGGVSSRTPDSDRLDRIIRELQDLNREVRED